MRTSILTLLIALCCCTSAAAQDAKVIMHGQIADTLLLTTYETPRGRQKKFARYELDAATKSEHILDVPDSLCNKRLFLAFNKTYTLLQVQKGQELHLNVEGQKLQFEGDDTKVNQYLYDWLNQYIKAFPNGLDFRMKIRNYFSRHQGDMPQGVETEQELAKIKGINQQATKQLLQYGVSDKQFVEEQKIWTKYLEERMLLANFYFIKSRKLSFSEQYKKAFSEISFKHVDILQHPDASEMLSLFFAMQEEVLGKKRVVPTYLKERAEEFKHDELKEIYVLDELAKLILSQRAFLIKETAESITPFVKTAKGKERLKRMQPSIEKMTAGEMRGKDAFEFEFEDNTGKKVKMSDFRGQYVFIDVWATWCAPCNINIPYLNMVEEELKDENIAFVSISVDKPHQKQKWLDFLAKTHIGGTALLANNAFQDPMCKYYGINAIPRFMLIDPQGKIVSAHCLQPMDAKFRAYLVDFMSKH